MFICSTATSRQRKPQIQPTSKTSVAFTQTNSDAGVTIPQFAEGDDFWAKFDVYIPDDTYSEVFCFSPRTYRAGLLADLYSYKDSKVYAYFGNGIRTLLVGGNNNTVGIKLGGINLFIVHIVYGDSSTALVEVFINGNHFFSGDNQIVYSTAYSEIARVC